MSRRAISGRLHRLWSGRDVGFVYAGLVSATAIVLALLPDHLHREILLRCSTNLTNLHHHPVFVLLSSAFVVSSAWGLYQMPFLVWVYGAAQRWVGRLPTVGVALLGHVGATLIVAWLLTEVVPDGPMARSAQHAMDVGVSYAGVCLAAFVVARVPRLMRPAYVLGVVGYFAGPVLVEPTFTDVGHTCSLLLGFGSALLVARIRNGSRGDTLAGSESITLEVGP
jgi:hypothetical protein